MNVEELISAANRLSAEERLQLMDALWENMPEEDRLQLLESYRQTAEEWAAEQELLPWQKSLLEERLAAADRNPQASVPWREAMTRLRNRDEPSS